MNWIKKCVEIDRILKTINQINNICNSISLSVDEILLPRRMNWSTNFGGFPFNYVLILKGDLAPFIF